MLLKFKIIFVILKSNLELILRFSNSYLLIADLLNLSYTQEINTSENKIN